MEDDTAIEQAEDEVALGDRAGAVGPARLIAVLDASVRDIVEDRLFEAAAVGHEALAMLADYEEQAGAPADGPKL